MAMYLFASGSPFEEILNVYMLSGRGVNPYNPKSTPFGGMQDIMYSNVTLPASLLGGMANATLHDGVNNNTFSSNDFGPLKSQ